MKKRSILFTGDMVKAILEGRKTQTRRVVKPQPTDVVLEMKYYASVRSEHRGKKVWHWRDNIGWHEYDHREQCPYGVPGDRLWVREAIRLTPEDVYYKADGHSIVVDDLTEEQQEWIADYGPDGADEATVPSIHMPRWASRITLEITDVRIERVQEISEEDAIAEGIESEHSWDGTPEFGYDMGMWYRDYLSKCQAMIQSPIDSFKSLWDSINGKTYPWESNPWVWARSFRRI